MLRINLFQLFFKFLIIGLISILAFSCLKEEEEVDPISNNMNLGKGFFVLNQGNFTSGNASMSFFRKDSSKMLNNLFYQRNGVPLGDVAQSMTFWKNYAFVVVNNSSTIWAINANTAIIAGKLSGLHSPRYVCVIDAEKSYVSDFQIPGITVFQTSTMQSLGTIPTGKTTERLLLHENKVFAANWSQYNQSAPNNTVQVIDAGLDQLVDSIVVAKEPNSMVIDKNGKLWVLCSGGFLNEELPALFKINPTTLEIEKRIDFPDINTSPEQLCLNSNADTLFFLNNGVYRMDIEANSIPDFPFIDSDGRNFYSLAIDPNTSEIVATDAGNYLQKGYVFRFKPDGTIIDSIAAGIIPGFIGFN